MLSAEYGYKLLFVILTGLQKEGWYIFKHLMTELLIVVIGFLTFVPAIQVNKVWRISIFYYA
jgi:hypothetical protein